MNSRRVAPHMFAVLLAAVSTSVAGAAPADGLRIVYALGPVADAVEATSPGSWIQTPTDHRSWPAARRLAKVKGTELSGRTAEGMAASLRGAIRQQGTGGLVGVDELSPGDWTEARARLLGRALDILGPDAARVVFYVSPSLTGGIARTDLRQPLNARHAAIVVATRKAGAVFLLGYHGDRTPMSAEEFARNATNWRQRFAPGDASRLHIMLGPAVGTTQADIWNRARASEAGRALLANGPGVWGIRDAAEGRTWAAEYRAFQGAPAAPPPTGDVAVIAGGGLSIVPGPGRAMTVALKRRGRAVVRLIKQGDRNGRVIAFLTGPSQPTRVPIPPDTRPGRYSMNVIALGDGIRDEVAHPLTVGKK